MYGVIKFILFLFDAEKVHHATMKGLSLMARLPFGKTILTMLYDKSQASQRVNVFGINFKNRVGLAAGFDKNAAYVDVLACLGFGFIEIGTVTPKAQQGNDKPRLFRLVKDGAIINRMGFNNSGVDAVVANLKRVKNKDVVIGGNIGKNKNTSNEKAGEDYMICFEKLYDHVHYFVINVSSPNTPGLRALQEKKPLIAIIASLIKIRKTKNISKPLLLKIAPDLTREQLDDIVDIVNETDIDGLVVSNTTIERNALVTDHKKVEAIGQGGLSGRPLKIKSDEILKYISNRIAKPIIGVGGIHSVKDAEDKFGCGASLIQLYTGFIFEGPALVGEIVRSGENAKSEDA